MALITKKNILNVGIAVRKDVWNSLRPYSDVRFKLRDLIPIPIPFWNPSASVKGVLACLVGEDPGA